MMDQKTQGRIVEAILTSATCGEGCWYAREAVCRCSCGGKNHGCLLDGMTERPARTSKIGGLLYELTEIGAYPELYHKAADALKDSLRTVIGGSIKVYWTATDKGSPLLLKAATKAQLAGWKELSGCAPRTYLLWKRVEVVERN